jgi:hypothetical protein
VVATGGAVSALGGLVGTLTGNGTVTNSHADGPVTGTSGSTAVGGLVGSALSGTVSVSYATGNVVGGTQIGGLIGSAQPAAANNVSIADTYATGPVTGTDRVGGLVGMVAGKVTIATSYANGALTASPGARLGGIAGDSAAVGSVSPAFTSTLFDSTTTGTATGVGAHAGTPGVTALTTAQLQTQSSFAGWSIDDQGATNTMWRLYPGQAPVLRHMLTPAYYVGGAVKTYDRRPFLVTGPVSAGIYALSSLASWQQGYDLIFGAGDKLTVNPAPLTASIIGAVTKAYDATAAAFLSASNYVMSGVLAGDTVQFIGPLAGSFDSKNVGTGKTVTVTGATLSGADAHNYALVSAAVSAAIGTITPAVLTASLTGDVSKVYDATTTAALAPANYTLGGVIGSDAVALNDPSTGRFDTKDVGAGKSVEVGGLALSGADAGNYLLSATAISGAVGVITPAILTASLTGSVSKIYDATTTASVLPSNFSLSGVLGSDAVVLNAPPAGTYDNRNAGTGKTVSVTGLTLNGADAGNYGLASSALSGALGTIVPASLTLIAGNAARPVGQANPPLTYGLEGLLGGDASTVLSGVVLAANADIQSPAGTYGIVSSGGNAQNYVIAQRIDGTLTVTQARSDVPGLRDTLKGGSGPDGTGSAAGASGAAVLTTADAGVGATAAIGEVVCLVSNETVNREHCSIAGRGKSAPLSNAPRTDRSSNDAAAQPTTVQIP